MTSQSREIFRLKEASSSPSRDLALSKAQVSSSSEAAWLRRSHSNLSQPAAKIIMQLVPQPGLLPGETIQARQAIRGSGTTSLQRIAELETLTTMMRV